MYTRNSKELLSILRVASERGELTQKERDRISSIDKSNINIKNGITIETLQKISSCYGEVFDQYSQIELDLGMTGEEGHKSINYTANQEDDEAVNDLDNTLPKEIDSMYFNSCQEFVDMHIQYFAKAVDENDKMDRNIRRVLVRLNSLSREREFQIEKEISNRRNSNIFEKWRRAIF